MTTGSERESRTLAELVDAGSYASLLAEAKAAVRSARVRAHLALNAELLGLYWRLGRLILERREAQGWGSRVIDRLSADLKAEFPQMKGLSPRNLVYMQTFAGAWPEFAQQAAAQLPSEPTKTVQQPVAQLPWGHIMVILDRLDDQALRDWYAGQAVAHGWSRNVLLNQIMSRLHRRLGAAPSNFATTLPAGDSELVQQMTKDPHNLEFLDLEGEVGERRLEEALVAHLQRFLLELGTGFAFVGRQYRLEVDDEEFFVDIIFYTYPGDAVSHHVVIYLGGDKILQAPERDRMSGTEPSQSSPDRPPRSAGSPSRKRQLVSGRRALATPVLGRGHAVGTVKRPGSQIRHRALYPPAVLVRFLA